MKREGSGREGSCKKACCWTPSSVCAKRGGCACHVRASKRGQTLTELLEAERRKQAAMHHQDNLNEGHTGDY